VTLPNGSMAKRDKQATSHQGGRTEGRSRRRVCKVQ